MRRRWFAFPVVVLAIAGCSTAPTGSISEGKALAQSGDFEAAARTFQAVASGSEGCPKAQALAAHSGALAAQSFMAVAEPIPEAVEMGRARFGQVYEDAIALVNRSSDCELEGMS